MADTITVTGVVGTEPQFGDAAGTPVCNFRLASSLRRYDKDAGKWTEYGTNWYSIGAYRYLGKNVAASVNKGDRVVVTGRVRLREWSNQTGRGMTIDIDATSVGHDLSWGTTVFHRHNESDSSHGTDPTPDTSDSSSGDEAESLSTVGSGPRTDPARPLVETDDWSTASIGAEGHEAA